MLREVEVQDVISKLVSLIPSNDIPVRIIYCMVSKANPDNPTWDYAADIKAIDNGFLYVLQGHGIGKNEKIFSSINELIESIESDNQRFNSSDKLHILLP